MRSTVIGTTGRISLLGAIRPGRVGEVILDVDGGRQTYYAMDADGGSVDAGRVVVVVEQTSARTVLVTELPQEALDVDELLGPGPAV